MKREMIVAYGAHDRAIGQQGDLPWGRDLPLDLARFRAYTLGKSVIMGRRTFESLPFGRPLPDRQNIVVTSRPLDANVTTVPSFEDAYDVAEWRPIVIGGATLYLAALPFTDVLYATEVDADFTDADTHFPDLDESWRESERACFPADARNRYATDFVTYEHS